MNANDPLADLADITVKEGVSWWPLAIGWWIVIVVVGVLAVAVVIYLWRRIQQLRPQKEAISQLLLLQQQTDTAAVVLHCASLLKQYIMRYRPEIAHYSLNQLATQLDAQGIALTAPSAALLDELYVACYQRPSPADTQGFDDGQTLNGNQSRNEVLPGRDIDNFVQATVRVVKELPPKKLLMPTEAERV